MKKQPLPESKSNLPTEAFIKQTIRAEVERVTKAEVARVAKEALDTSHKNLRKQHRSLMQQVIRNFEYMVNYGDASSKYAEAAQWKKEATDALKKLRTFEATLPNNFGHQD